MREDKIDDFISEMKTNRFWSKMLTTRTFFIVTRSLTLLKNG